MNVKAEPCRLFIEQTIDEALDAGRKDFEEVAREMFDFLTEHFDTEIKARSLAQALRRKAEKRNSEPKIVTPVTYTKAEKTYIDRATNQAKHDVAFHRNNAGELGPLPDEAPATLKARAAISYLREIHPDDPGRLEALNAVAEYLQSQGFELVKPTTSKE